MSSSEHPHQHLKQNNSDKPHDHVRDTSSDHPSCPPTVNDCQQQYLQKASLASPAETQAQARNRILQAYDILDSPPEEGFDKITRLAAQTFGVPISMITFIDTERQWFKSHHGTDLCETDLSASFCLCAVQDGRTLIVPNALEESRFFDNPAVTSGLVLRYYVGAPLITPEGVALGTLCLIDTEPRPRPSADQIEMLETLASMVVDEMRLRRSLREQQKTETYLQKLLNDKNVLLKEIHHRVKNNLQLVSSMLSIHSRQLQDEGAKAALRESRERIGVIAKVHELMYAATTTNAAVTPKTPIEAIDTASDAAVAENHIDIASLLTDLANNVVRLATQPVVLELNLDAVHLDIHRAIPLSLIVNELLTNAIKYAFITPTDRPPKITISANIINCMHRVDGANSVDGINNVADVNAIKGSQSANTTPYLHILVSDNGVGLATEADIHQAASLGFTVVKTLSEQIDAELSWRNQTPSGLAVSVVLPLQQTN